MRYNAKLIGAGHCLPERVVTGEELETQMEFDKFHIRKGMSKLLSGVKERRFARSDQNSSDFAADAAKEALKNANLSPQDIDMVIFASLTQDLAEPATVNIVMQKLGMSNIKGFDVKNACNAFMTAIEVANMYIKSGDVGTVLITSGEVLSRFVRMKYDDPKDINEANATFSVGDGGAAIILQRYESDENDLGIQTKFTNYPDTWEDGALLGGGTMYPHDPDKFYFQNETREMMKRNFGRAMAFFTQAMEEMNIIKDDVALFVPTQITKYLVIKSAEVLGLPLDRVVCQITELGNVSASNIPLAISRAVDEGTLKIGTGQKVVCFGIGNGFSIGLAYMQI